MTKELKFEIVKSLIEASGIHVLRGEDQANNIVEISKILCNYITQDSNLHTPKDKVLNAPKR